MVRQPGDLGVLRGVDDGYSEKARTRGFASLAFARFAFPGRIVLSRPNTVNSGMYLERLLVTNIESREMREQREGG